MDQGSEFQTPIERLTKIPIETIKVGNITVTAFPIEHTTPLDKVLVGDNGQNALDQLGRLVDSTDGVLFEYFPPELDKIPSTLRAISGKDETFREYNDFFEPVANLARRKGKTALVADPAYDEWFTLLLDPHMQAIEGLGIVGLGTLPAYLEARNSSKTLNNPNELTTSTPLTRRQLLKLGGFAAGGIVGFSMFGGALWAMTNKDIEWRDKKPNHHFNEAELRRVMVAEGLETLGAHPEYAGKNITLVYPPVHWQGIKDILASSQRREKFEQYTIALKGPLADKFLTVRQYAPSDNGWQAIPSIRIG